MHSGRQIALAEFALCASRSGISLNGHVEWHDLHFRGPFSLVYQGTLHPLRNRVAVKTILSGTPTTKKDTIEEAVRKLYILSQVHHENVCPLLGITTEFYPNISVVSAWMENGNAHDYVQAQSIDPRPLIDGIARGLLYLHSHELGPIIHGNLKGSNVLISPEGLALLADFGLPAIFDSSLVVSPTISHGRAPNWMAPENLENGEATVQGDVWAFAMTILVRVIHQEITIP
ncbi:hypothetical protein ID866_9415 [Astraeus odoratus]|nr:hypothetical protein ID866_9415 [Astraeus odoratus]